jgi:AcrR family transcriptional regulator
MLANSLELAAEGGWDAVQMREVAARSNVAIGTLYRYFPSKENLLVSVMLQQIRDLSELISQRPPSGEQSAARVEEVLARANKALQSTPEVTTAMIKALVSGNTDVAQVVAMVRDEMRGLLAFAYHGSDAVSEDDLLRIDLLSDIWLATLISWICGIEEAGAVQARLGEAVGSLFN